MASFYCYLLDLLVVELIPAKWINNINVLNGISSLLSETKGVKINLTKNIDLVVMPR